VKAAKGLARRKGLFSRIKHLRRTRLPPKTAGQFRLKNLSGPRSKRRAMVERPTE
jgi:hypothetical protein